MTTQDKIINGEPPCTQQEYMLLLSELEEVQETNRRLKEQLKKAEKAASNAERMAAEATRAHAKMVATLTETMRENNALTIDRDMWKSRAQRVQVERETPRSGWDLSSVFGFDQVTEDEAKAIRKAIARLHHPDSGGDAERMKLWNAALDRIEHR